MMSLSRRYKSRDSVTCDAWQASWLPQPLVPAAWASLPDWGGWWQYWQCSGSGDMATVHQYTVSSAQPSHRYWSGPSPNITTLGEHNLDKNMMSVKTKDCQRYLIRVVSCNKMLINQLPFSSLQEWGVVYSKCTVCVQFAIPSLPLCGASRPGVSISVRKVLYLQITWHMLPHQTGWAMEWRQDNSYMPPKDDFIIYFTNQDLSQWRKIDEKGRH